MKNRRISSFSIALVATLALAAHLPALDGDLPTLETYLRKSVVDRKTLDVFLDPRQLSWAKFDPVTAKTSRTDDLHPQTPFS